MNAEVIAIGDELTSGQRLDTNSPWLSQRLGELGIPVIMQTTVGDDLATNVEVFRSALQRADVVLCTGGLGPTADDLTRQALAEATGRPLVLDEAVLAHIRDLFARRQRPMPESNVIQAMFPRGSRVIPNPHGTAPGIELEAPRGQRPACRLFVLPGVPAEMRDMWRETVEPALLAANQGPGRVLRRRQIHCFGAGESDLEQMLPDLIRRGRQPTVGITASQATITLRITAEGDCPEACEAQLETTAATIRQHLGQLVFGEGDDQLQHVASRMLRQRGQSLATAEWELGGLAAHWMSEASKDGEFLGGWVLGSAAAAARLAGLPPGPFEQDGLGPSAYDDLAAALAEACRQRHGAVFGLAAGPCAARGGRPSAAATLHCALVGPSGKQIQSSAFTGHPEMRRARGAKQALNLLRLSLS